MELKVPSKNVAKGNRDAYYFGGFFIAAQLLVMAMLIKLEIDSTMDLPSGDGFPRNLDQTVSCMFFYVTLLFAGIFVGIILRTWKLIGLQLLLPVVGLFAALILGELCRR